MGPQGQAIHSPSVVLKKVVATRLEHRSRCAQRGTQGDRFVGRLPKYNTFRGNTGGALPCVRMFNRPGASRDKAG
jgi:hypothetical protein